MAMFNRQASKVEPDDTQVCLNGDLPNGRTFRSCERLTVMP